MLALLIVVVITYIFISNNLNRMIVKIEELEAGIDVVLAKRFDILTRMFSVTKGYAEHELKTLEKITKLRAPGRADSIEQK